MKISVEDIIGYLDDNLSGDKKKEIDDLISNNPEMKNELEDLKEMGNFSGNDNDPIHIDTDSACDKMSKKISGLEIRRNLWNVTRTVAVILLPIVIIGSIFWHGHGSVISNDQTREISVSSACGIVSKIVLPDSSLVWLNSGSLLRYSDSFGDERKVYLSGEAYFKVKSDRNHRFDVLTENGTIVSAYGTEFNINAYNDEMSEEVLLSKGNLDVTYSGISKKVVLIPGQMSSLNKDLMKVNTSEADIYSKTAWRDGKIVFRRTDMGKVARILSKHFNVDILLQDEDLYSYQYSATFTNESIEEILRLLAKSSPITWKIKDS